MAEPYYDLMGPKRFNPWSKETPIWWCCYRSYISGIFSKDDWVEWRKSQTSYIIYFDHSREEEARLLGLRVMERDDHFKACKVSKFARDGEKVIIFLGKDDTRKHVMADLCKEMGFVLHKVRQYGEATGVENHLSAKYDEYLRSLANAFRPMGGDGGVRVTGLKPTDG